MKQFFKMMLASALGVVIAGGILSFISFFMMIGVVSSLSSSSDKIPKGDEKVLVLNLRGSLPEVSVDNPFGNLMKQNKSHSVKDIISAIENAKENKQIEGILLDVDYLLTGTATVDYLRRALIDFKQSGKFVVAYGDSYTQNGYYLSSVADKVFLNPLGALSLSGFSSQVMFYKGILKKAGVEMLVFKVGTFKGAVEPFMLDKLSDANREQITAYQQGLWKNIVANIAADRNITGEQINGFADNGLMFTKAENAVEYGLVDELRYREDAVKYVKGLVGADLLKPLKTVDVAKMKNISKKKPDLKADRIAVVYAEGNITSSELVSPYGNENNITEKLVDELIKVKHDDKVKAVVLRVNSPGGSVFVSEQIWKQVNDLKNEKKVVVSMGNVAASGGYYISCAADKIVAEANTLTGSIGVFGIFPNATGLCNMLDLTTDVVKTNKFGDMGDPSRPMREDEKALIQNRVERIYDLFLQRCSDGRGNTKEESDVIAQGRV
jgi:protease-4